MNAKKALGSKDRERVRQAIARAESSTSSEMVAAVATESGRYDRADSTVGLLAAIAFLVGAHWLHDSVLAAPGQWDVGSLHVGWQALAVVAGFVIGNLISAHCPPFRRLFVSERHMTQNAQRGASHVFTLADVAGTRERTGLLIYISLFEHRIVIRADERARQALGDEGIAHLRDLAVDDLKGGLVANALIDVIEHAAGPLAEALPAQRELTDREIDSHLLILHPRPSAYLIT